MQKIRLNSDAILKMYVKLNVLKMNFEILASIQCFDDVLPLHCDLNFFTLTDKITNNEYFQSCK